MSDLSDHAKAEAISFVGDWLDEVTQVRITLLTEDGTEVYNDWFRVRPGDTLTYPVPTRDDIEVSDA